MLVISFCLFVLGSVSCAQPPIYNTANGQVRGRIHRSLATNEDVQIFYGVPYAKPPIGDLRFENPVDPDDWTPTVRNATTLHARCHQYNSQQDYVDFYRPNTPGENEDCLYLNIFVPTSTTHNKAVLVFIHGGSNVVGSANMFDGTELASVGDIIVVTVNYRLAVLGFFGTGEDEFPGNYGLRDQIKALEWVRDNIANFGGDTSQVTLAGHSSAAWNVGRHLVSPLAAGLFRAVVSISGSPTLKSAFRTMNASDPQSEIQKMAKAMNCNITMLKQCLRTKTALEVSKAFSFQIPHRPFSVLLDNDFFPINQNAVFNARHYLISYTTDEGYSFAKKRQKWPVLLKYFKNFDRFRSDVDVSERQDDSNQDSGGRTEVSNAEKATEIIQFEYTDWNMPEDSTATLRSLSNCVSNGLVKVPSVHAANVLAEARLDVYLYEWSHGPPSQQHGSWSVAKHTMDLHYLFGDPFYHHHIYNFTDLDKQMSRALMETMGNYVKDLIFAPTSRLSEGRQWKYNNDKTYLQFVDDNPTIQVRNNPLPRDVEFWENYLPDLSERLI